MSEPKAALGAGNIDINLNNKIVTLRPTLEIALAVSRQAGGILACVDAVGRFDLDAIAGVIAKSAGLEQDAVAMSVYAAGVGKVAPKVLNFLFILANGGRPPEKGGEEGQNPPSGG